MNGLLDSEHEKYLRVWREESYRDQADGEPVVNIAFESMGCREGESLIDWGCGSGIPAAEFKKMGLSVRGFDIAENCLNEDADVELVVGTLWDPPLDLIADYAFSSDVLEHIPPSLVPRSVEAICARTRKAAYIQVDTEADISGPRMDPPETLHLTVRSEDWWEGVMCCFWSEVVRMPGAYSRVGFLCKK